LAKNNVNVKEIDFSVYQQRQKQLRWVYHGDTCIPLAV
jgi:hypothetical protein